MTDIEILQECKMATIEERAIARQIIRLLQIGGPKGIGSQALEPAGDRKTNNATAGQLQQLDGLIQKLNKKREESLYIVQRAESIIERIMDRRNRVIIRCYYVEGESDYEIARDMDMSPQWVQQQRNKTLDGLTQRKI